MIAWGGLSNNMLVNTGGRYDPVADVWNPTSTANAPSARSAHAAVWSGTSMIVWGGSGGNSLYLGTGGRYNPVSNSWTVTSPDGASPRAIPAAVWTGDSILVWGGHNGQPLNSGGGYCACAMTTFFRDADGDGFGTATGQTLACNPPAGYVASSTDCDDTSASFWQPPGEVRDDVFIDRSTLTWSPPSLPGATSLLYDVLRSRVASNFQLNTTCIATDTPSNSTIDATAPPVGTAHYYLLRAQDGCPNGQGPLGNASNGTSRTGRSCP